MLLDKAITEEVQTLAKQPVHMPRSPRCVKEVAPAYAGAKPNEVLLLATRHAATFAFVSID